MSAASAASESTIIIESAVPPEPAFGTPGVPDVEPVLPVPLPVVVPPVDTTKAVTVTSPEG